ncbi:MAG: hypothetical protein J2P16_11040 [Mycobacterium sp.]|nr:hypothetical protein [Mycobacterium sp.]
MEMVRVHVSEQDLQLLAAAAAALASVERADPDEIGPAVWLHCVRAVELLEAVRGAWPEELEAADPCEIPAVVAGVLLALGRITPGVFVFDPIVEAAAEVRLALQLWRRACAGDDRLT